MEVIVVEVAVFLLLVKLENLDAQKEAIHPGFRLSALIRELNDLQRLLREEGRKTGLSIQLLQFLRDVYHLDNIIDKVLLKSSLLRERLLIKKLILPLHLLMSIWNQQFLGMEMAKFADSLKKMKGCLERSENGDPLAQNDEIGDGPTKDGIQDGRDHSGSSKQSGASTSNTKVESLGEKQIAPAEESDIVGLKDQAEELDHLVRGSHKLPFIISVTGMPGSGKTTLVRRIFSRVLVKQRMDCCAWISLSREFEVQQVLIEILRQVTVISKEGRLPIEDLLQRVHNFLNQKRYLIVLDDVQSSDIWQKLRLAFPNQLNGSRLILISQGNNGLQISDPWIWSLQLRPLNEEESWELFLKKVRLNESRLKEAGTISLKENILGICGALPLKIVMLGSLLSTRGLNHWEWSMVVKPANLSGTQSDSLDVFALGFWDLPSSLKACLLCMGLFPRSYEIPVRRLLRLWIAEGLAISSTGEMSRPEDLTEKQFAELVRRNIIEVARWRLDGSPKTCRVPGILHDILFPGAADMGFFYAHYGGECKLEPDFHLRRIVEYSNISGNNSLDLHIQDLRSYLSFRKRRGDKPADEVTKLLKKVVTNRSFGLLTVLDLERLYKPALPETLGKLLHLKYLGLRWTFLDSVPKSVGKLVNLETLDVKHTNITNLPISFWKAKKLRHLYMNNIHFDIPRHKFSSNTPLDNLQTLTGLLIGSNSSMIFWLQRLVGLKKLGLTCHKSSIEKIIQWISGLKDLRSLRLTSIDDDSQPSFINLKSLKERTKLNELHLLGELPRNINLNELPKSLKILSLSLSQLGEDPMPVLGKLPDLKILRLFAGSYKGKQMTCPRGDFPELRLLQLWMLEELESWTSEDGSMPSLRELEIRGCMRLEPTDGLQKVATLEQLILTNMPENFSERIKAIMGGKVFIKKNEFNRPPLPKNVQRVIT